MVWIGVLLALSMAVQAVPTFTIDAAHPILAAPLNIPLLDCVGSGHAALAMRADYQAHLSKVQV